VALGVEDKFRVHPDFVLPELNGDQSAIAAVSPPRTCAFVATYHDTEDLRLARSGISLRHRSGEGTGSWQLRARTETRPGARYELDAAGDAAAIPATLRALVVARTRREELAPRATLTTERTTYDLLDAEHEIVAELVDDQVEAHHGGHRVARFREIEVEDRGGGSEVLDMVGARLREAGAVQGESQPKVVRVLGHRASAPPDPPLAQPVTRRDPARAVVAATLRDHVHRLLDNDLVVRGEFDDDGVHQLRVAARRLRSVLLDFGPLVDASWSADLRTELRWLGQQLSPARDLQVVEARLMAAISELPEELNRDAARRQVERVLAPEIATAKQTVVSTLSDERHLDLLDELVDAATHPRTTDQADQPCRKAMPPLVSASRKRLAKRFGAAIDWGTVESHHKARKAAKRTRYLAEALIPVYGKQALQFADAVKQMQELLGEHQDAALAAATLQRIAAGSRTAPATFVLGMLYSEQLRQAATLREQFAELAPMVARPRSQRWVKR
jgi:CHAD domain-containing protein